MSKTKFWTTACKMEHFTKSHILQKVPKEPIHPDGGQNIKQGSDKAHLRRTEDAAKLSKNIRKTVTGLAISKHTYCFYIHL